MRHLIIGTTGQLALELRRTLPATHIELAPPEKVDLTDPVRVKELLDRAAPDLVINAAAYTAVDKAETEAERAFAVNRDGPATLATWCHERGASLIHVSTDYVFDGSKTEAYEVDDATNPLGVYGASKLAGEQAIRDRLERHLILRTSWVFSPFGANFVKTMLRLGKERDELRIVSDQRGRPTSARELARAIWHAARQLEARGTSAWGTYHAACAGETTWFDFAQAIIEAAAPQLGKRPRVTPIGTADYPTPARRPANSVLSTRTFEATFSFQFRHWSAELHDTLVELGVQ